MTYHFKVHHDDDGFWAEGLELPTCLSQGESLSELEVNLKDALDAYLDEGESSSIRFPLPLREISIDDSTLAISVDSRIAFALLLRQSRLDRHLSQRKVAEMMGLKHKFSYSRLESKANPSLQVIDKVLKVFPDFPLQDCFENR